MIFRTSHLSYPESGFFTPVVLDYISGSEQLKPFVEYDPQHPDFGEAIRRRRLFPTQRKVLVDELEQQYQGIDAIPLVLQQIRSLSRENTFTVCTAHQPNLFTGYLYFVYKLLQTIKLATELNSRFPGNHFVPVYYMGSEDADLNELNRIHVNGETLVWNTAQTGAVGKMSPSGLEEIMSAVRSAFGEAPFGKSILDIFEKAYRGQPTIQRATLQLVDALFGKYGLVVLIADTQAFKKQLVQVFREDLFQNTCASTVESSTRKLSTWYKVQANPRQINLFYLQVQSRERIVRNADQWQVINTGISWNARELEQELTDHPERFSPNVILRGLLQESILPNLAFIGGGGELSYWLELKGLFNHFKVPYPILILRNSVMWVNASIRQKLNKLDLSPEALFMPADRVIATLVKKQFPIDSIIAAARSDLDRIFSQLSESARLIDPTLVNSVQAHQARAGHLMKRIAEKFLRTLKKKMSLQTAQIESVRENLFPHGSLQERVENIIPFYSHYGDLFFDTLLEELDPLNRSFTIITEIT